MNDRARALEMRQNLSVKMAQQLINLNDLPFENLHTEDKAENDGRWVSQIKFEEYDRHNNEEKYKDVAKKG